MVSFHNLCGMRIAPIKPNWGNNSLSIILKDEFFFNLFKIMQARLVMFWKDCFACSMQEIKKHI